MKTPNAALSCLAVIALVVGLVGCAPGADDGSDSQVQAIMASVPDVLKLARKAGLPCDQLVTAVAIASAESGLNPQATHSNGNGSVDRGLWQINSVHRIPQECLFNPECNARAMAAISRNGKSWSPWTTYQQGQYRRFMTAVQQIYNATAPQIEGCTSNPETPDAGPAMPAPPPVVTACEQDAIRAATPAERRGIIERALAWSDNRAITYNQSGCFGGYRTDCSGLVSMAWQLPGGCSCPNTRGLAPYSTALSRTVDFSQLRIGDAINRKMATFHTMIFAGWVGSAGSGAMCAIEHGGNPNYPHRRVVYMSELANYYAITYNDSNTPPGITTEPSSGGFDFSYTSGPIGSTAFGTDWSGGGGGETYGSFGASSSGQLGRVVTRVSDGVYDCGGSGELALVGERVALATGGGTPMSGAYVVFGNACASGGLIQTGGASGYMDPQGRPVRSVSEKVVQVSRYVGYEDGGMGYVFLSEAVDGAGEVGGQFSDFVHAARIAAAQLFNPSSIETGVPQF